jgi:predicted nucleic acid-binding protein
MAGANVPAGLIDTDGLIDAMRGHIAAQSFLVAQRAQRGPRISAISAMELIQGCQNGSNQAKVRQFLQHSMIEPVSSPASQRAYQLMDSFFLSHGGATAIVDGLTLFTKNIRHFQPIPHLAVVRSY